MLLNVQIVSQFPYRGLRYKRDSSLHRGINPCLHADLVAPGISFLVAVALFSGHRLRALVFVCYDSNEDALWLHRQLIQSIQIVFYVLQKSATSKTKAPNGSRSNGSSKNIRKMFLTVCKFVIPPFLCHFRIFHSCGSEYLFSTLRNARRKYLDFHFTCLQEVTLRWLVCIVSHTRRLQYERSCVHRPMLCHRGHGLYALSILVDRFTLPESNIFVCTAT